MGSSATTGAAVATALNWNGSTGTQVATPVSTTSNLSINAISGTSASDVWVVGETVTPGYHNRQFTSVIMHDNGSSWTQMTAPDNSGCRTSTPCRPQTRGPIAGVVSLTHYNGTSWTSASDPAGVNAMTGHAVLSPSDIWFSGYYYPSNAVTAPAVLSTTSG